MKFDWNIVSSGLASIGALLLAGGVKETASKIAVWAIFLGFLIQAVQSVYNLGGTSMVVGLLVYLVIGLLLGFRKQIFKKR